MLTKLLEFNLYHILSNPVGCRFVGEVMGVAKKIGMFYLLAQGVNEHRQDLMGFEWCREFFGSDEWRLNG